MWTQSLFGVEIGLFVKLYGAACCLGVPGQHSLKVKVGIWCKLLQL